MAFVFVTVLSSRENGKTTLLSATVFQHSPSHTQSNMHTSAADKSKQRDTKLFRVERQLLTAAQPQSISISNKIYYS